MTTSSVSSARGRCLELFDIFVLAGGLGTRIRPILGDVPKLLAPIDGRPYLRYLLDWLRRFGARRVVLGLGHGSAAVLDYLSSHPVHDLDLGTIVEPEPLGTAGALRLARAELHTDPVLVMNGDSFCDADLCALAEQHRAAGTPGTVLCAEVDDAGRYGRVVVDRNGLIRAFVEKDPTFRGKAAVNTGVYLLSAALLDEIAAGQTVSLERDVFERLPAGSLAAFTGRFRFIDIGTPESLALAEGILRAVPSEQHGGMAS